MIPIYVPDFKKKLDLVAHHAGYKNIAAISAEMGVKEPTLRSWTKAHTGRREGMVSKKGREPVISFFCAQLPHLSEKSVIALLEGPYDDMAAAFLSVGHSSLSELIDEEAVFDEAEIIIGHEGRFEAGHKGFSREAWAGFCEERSVRVIPLNDPKPRHQVPIGTYFRFEFRQVHRAKYFLALQQSSQGWTVIAGSPDKEAKIVRVPSARGKEITVLCEDHDYGDSRFTLIQSTRPFPDFIHINLKDGIPLSRTEIAFLTQHLLGLSKPDRTFQAVDVYFCQIP